MVKRKSSRRDSVEEEILSKGKESIKDFDDSQEVYVEPDRLESKLISIRLPTAMIKNLRVIAREKGDIGYQQIIKSYIAEGLQRDARGILSNKQQLQPSCQVNNPSASSALDQEFSNESWMRSGTWQVVFK